MSRFDYLEKFVDLSSYQGAVNMDKLSQMYRFIIHRSTIKSGALDSKLERNVKAARDHKMMVDYYKFMYSMNRAEAVAEIRHTVEMLDKRNLMAATTTIWLDLESWSLRAPHTPAQLKDIVDGAGGWLDSVGVDWGIYCNLSYLKMLPDVGDKNIWLARYISLDKGYDYNCKDLTKKFNIVAWQYTSHGTAYGVNGFVDMNVLLK